MKCKAPTRAVSRVERKINENSLQDVGKTRDDTRKMLSTLTRARCGTLSGVDAREKRLFRLYALRPGDYERILEEQGGVCAICRRAPKALRHLHVDHRHDDGLTRGLLCWICNRALQGFLDDPRRLR